VYESLQALVFEILEGKYSVDAVTGAILFARLDERINGEQSEGLIRLVRDFGRIDERFREWFENPVLVIDHLVEVSEHVEMMLSGSSRFGDSQTQVEEIIRRRAHCVGIRV